MSQLMQHRTFGSRVLTLGVLITTLLAASLLLAVQPAHASTTFVVDSTADYGDQTPGDGKCDIGTIMLIGERCTLRAAIQEANATTGADIINFAIPAGQDSIISPTSQLPTITHPVTINGYSQPGAQPNSKTVGSDAILKIVLSGAGVPGGDGLMITGSNSTVRGLVINRWSRGILIGGAAATGNKVTGNYIGTDASGTQSVGNFVGVRFQFGSNNTVGGTTAAQRNVVSGNGFSGVSIGDGDTTGNKVTGNYIGTDASGTKDLGNARYGVNVDSVTGNTIGGTTAGERNVISGNDMSGIHIEASRTKVIGNYVGTDATGTKDLGNRGNGVQIQIGSNNIIGGTTVGERNVISGNDESGIRIGEANATGNKVVGNFIGTDKNGTAPLGNTYDGVRLYDSTNNIVGGTTAGVRNVISGNKNNGVLIFGNLAKGNKISGNYVGTDVTGTKDLGNASYGVVTEFAPDNTIGGTTAGERNIISGNSLSGVLIDGTGATGNKVVGNYLGTDKNGAAVLGNSANGVFIADTSNNTVGGTTAGARNVISDNDGSGVSILGNSATGNRVLQNSIFANGGLGIDLGDDGPTANDAGDADTGPNNLQNFPVLTSAKTGSTTTTIRGTLNSTPDTTFKVEFYSNPSGTNEGKKLIGQQLVKTDGSGNASFGYSPQSKVELGQNITATATSPGGDTSEFSAPRKVVAR